MTITNELGARDTGLEPVTFGSGGRRGGVAPSGTASHLSGTIGRSTVSNSHAFAPIHPNSHPETYPALTQKEVQVGPGAAVFALPSAPTMTPIDVAARLKVTPTSVRHWCQSGHMPARMVGGRYLISEEDLAAFLERGRGGGQ